MATFKELEQAFMRAHAAGDTKSAQLLANALRAQTQEGEVQPIRPDRTLTEAFTRGASRGFERLKSTVGDVIPGMAASALGFDEYAKRQMAEAADTQRMLQETNPAEFESYKQITSPYEALKYGAETIGETTPDIAASLLPGGVGGVLGRRAAVSGARAVGPLLPAVEAAAGATGAARGQAVGVYLGSYAQTAPEVFQGIYQETGQLEPGVAALFGSASAALDAILPAQLLRSMSGPVKVGVIEKILERSGMEPSLLRKVISQVPGSAAKEGLTEGAQEAINIAAEKFVNDNATTWGSKEWERLVESGVRGAVAGGAFGAVGAVPERGQERSQERLIAERAAQAEQARIAALPPEVTPLEQVETRPETMPREVAPGITQIPETGIYTTAEEPTAPAGREIPRPVPETGPLEMVGQGAPSFDINQGNLPGVPLALDQTTPVAEVPEAPEKEMPTVLAPEVLDRTGLPKQSGLYKQLVGKDLTNLEDLDAVMQTVERAKTNKGLTADTKNALESIATQAFSLYGQQAEMFGGNKKVGTVLEEPTVKLTPAIKKITAVTAGKDMNNPADVAAIREQLTDYANGPTRSAKVIQEVSDYLDSLPTAAPTPATEVLSEQRIAKPAPVEQPITPPVEAMGEPTLSVQAAPTETLEAPAATEAAAPVTKTPVVEAPVAGPAFKPTAPAAPAPISEGRVSVSQAANKVMGATGLSRAESTKLVNTIERFGEVDPVELDETIRNVPQKAKYRVAEVGGKGTVKGRVSAVVAAMSKGWKNAPKISVVQSISELPQELQDQIKRDGVNPKGAFDPDTGVVFLVADNITGDIDVAMTLAHEALGHFGLRSLLGAKFNSIMNTIYTGNKSVKARADAKIAEGLDKETAIEEVLAEMAEEVANPNAKKDAYKLNALQRVVNAIRQFFAGLGFPLKGVTDGEIRGLIVNARASVISGEGKLGAGRLAQKGEGTVAKTKAVYRTAINNLGSTTRTQPPYSNKFMEDAKNAASKLPGSLQEAFFGFWTMPQLAQTYGKELPSIAMLDKTLGERAATLTSRQEVIGKNIDTWYKVANKHKALLPKFFDIANETTLTQIDPLDPVNANSPLTKQFKQLPQDLQDVYAGLRKEYDNYSDLFITELVKNLTGTPASKMRAEFETKRLKVYLPLRRFGEYWATYKDKNGDRVSAAFDSPRERTMAMEDAKKAGGTDFQEHARLSQISFKQTPPTGFMGNVILQLKQAGVEEDVINNVYQSYMTLFPAESLRQQFRPRKGTLGYEADVFQAYADVARKMANQLTNMEYAKDIDTSVTNIRTEATDTPSTAIKNVVANIDKQLDFVRNPVNNRLARDASYVSYIMYIAGNISSALVNLTQLPIVVYPMLAGKYGVGATTAAMQRATAMYFKGGKDTNSTFLPDHTFGAKAKGEHKQLYDAAVNRSVIRRSTGYEITEARKSTVDSYTGLRAKVEHGLGWVFQNSERANREITLIAAFDLARSKGRSVEQSIEDAIALVNDAHGAALAETGPRFFQTGIGKVAFTFKRFAQSQIYLLARLFNEAFRGADQVTRDTARKQLLGIAGMSYMFAGVQGMPLYGAASLLAEMLMGDDDEPFDADASVRAALGDLGYKGPVNQLLNVDIASRTGFNGILWREDPKRLAEIGPMLYALEQAAGPVYGLARSAERGGKLIIEGNVERGLEALAPSFIRNGMKSFRLGTEGALTKDGVPIVDDISAYNTFMQVFGFNPAELAEAQARAGAEKVAEKTILNRRVALLNKIDIARVNGDFDGVGDAMEAISNFNEKNPEISITGDTISRSFKERRRREQEMVDGVSLNRKLRLRLMEEYGN